MPIKRNDATLHLHSLILQNETYHPHSVTVTPSHSFYCNRNIEFSCLIMADIGLHRSIQSPKTLLMPTTPLQLSRFLTGDTIQVKGDTGNLKFSVQFSIQDKHILDHNNNLLNSPGADSSYRENENHSCQNSSFSSYVTPPNDVQEVEDENSQSTEGDSTRPIVTRLRSGVISPVNYFPRISSSSSSGLRPCERKRNGRKNRKNDSVFERVLRRRRSPIRPCTSYAFFCDGNLGFRQVLFIWGNK